MKEQLLKIKKINKFVDGSIRYMSASFFCHSRFVMSYNLGIDVGFMNRSIYLDIEMFSNICQETHKVRSKIPSKNITKNIL